MASIDANIVHARADWPVSGVGHVPTGKSKTSATFTDWFCFISWFGDSAFVGRFQKLGCRSFHGGVEMSDHRLYCLDC